MTTKKRKTSESSAKVRQLARYITEKLKDAGLYSPTLTYQIEVVSGDILAYRKLREAFLSDDAEVVLGQTSREGHDRVKINPCIYAMLECGKRVREGLDGLTMNVKSRKHDTPHDDPLAELRSMMLTE